jgi:hypothetical protein
MRRTDRKSSNRWIVVLALGGFALGLSGCGCTAKPANRPSLATNSTTTDDGDKTAEVPGEVAAKDASSKSAADGGAAKPFKFGDLIGPFAASLAELDKTVEWIDRPVVDP